MPNFRDLHDEKIPKLMGTVFYFGFILASVFLFRFQSEDQMVYLITSLSIIFYVGVRDDIYNMSPWSKIILQGMAISIILFSKDLLLINLHGFLGIYELPILLAYPLTGFIGVFMINSFNLIDGIDGLAGIMGIFMLTCFGIIFYVLDDLFLVYSIVILIGTISGYLRFNLSTKTKVFMGDTGSLILGFFIFYFLLQLINHRNLGESAFFMKQGVTIWIGLLIFLHPILDSGSVFLSRIKKGKHPFSPDNSHIHHLLLVRFKSHLVVSLILLSFAFFSVLINTLVIFLGSEIYKTFIPIFLLISFSIIYVMRKYIRTNSKEDIL
jgi:UDP-N-acetylmuramyl pentapeptide phosphotransferase/UDP-N-acetylglucosamine-1-phosphate transferase